MIKKLLLWIPIFIFLFLLQSYFWVPTYDDQTRSYPARLEEFITYSIGDASLLNPILSSDSASSEIEAKIFEGLLDRDRDLSLRPRIAKNWSITEEAFFYIPTFSNTDDPNLILQKIKMAVEKPQNFSVKLREALSKITQIELLPPQKKLYHLPSDVSILISEPAQIKIVLSQIVPSLFEDLTEIMGKNYFNTFSPLSYATLQKGKMTPAVSDFIIEKLPSTRHHPIITFALRNDVYFHDGHKLTSKDVLFTYEAIMNPKNLSPRIADFEPVLSVTAPRSDIVKVTYKRLYSPAIESWTMRILPEHLLNKKALQKEAISLGRDPNTFSMRDSHFNKAPIGCGPFVFEEWKTDQYIILKCFKRYWEGAPHYKRFIWRIIPDSIAAEMEFLAGTLDNYAVQPHQLPRFENNQDYQAFSGTGFGYSFIGYNMRRPPFDDIRIRTALGMAIDTTKILNFVLYGQGERITGPFLKQTSYYNQKINPLSYDPQSALLLLEKAGWKKNKKGILEKNGVPLSFTLITNSGNDLRKSILTIVQESWRKIGVDVKTDLIEWSVFVQERINKLDFDAVVLAWQMSIEPDLYQVWHSSQTKPGQLNFIGYHNPEADRLIVKIREEYDEKKRILLCHQLHQVIAQDQPYTFLYVTRWTAVLDKRIVIYRQSQEGVWEIQKIQPTKAGIYNFDFNEWIKLDKAPVFAI